MKLLYLGITLFFLLIPLNAWADFDVRMNVNVPVVITNTSYMGTIGAWRIRNLSGDEEDKESLVGLGGTAVFGYRWTYLGVYLEQCFRGLWWIKSVEQSDDGDAFLGGTFVVGRFFYSFNPNFDIDFGVGGGVMYGDGSIPDADSGISKERAMLYDETGKPRPTPAIRFEIGGSYYITRSLAVGLHLAYSLVFDYYKIVMYAGLFKANVKLHRKVHLMDPGVHVIYRF